MAAVDASAHAASAPAAGPDWAGSLRDAVFAALVAFGLFGLLVGLKTDQTLANEVVLVPRPGLLAALVAAVFVGRLLISAYAWRRDGAASRASGRAAAKAAKGDGKVLAPGGNWAERAERSFGPVLLAFAVLWPVLGALSVDALVGVRYWVDLGTLILTYVMLGWGLNIVVGLAGLLDLGYVAFYAVGAYSYALLSTSAPVTAFMAETFGPNFWPLWAFWFCLPVAGVLAALWGVMLGFPVLRLRGDYLAIVTLAFGEIIRLVLINWVPVTGGYAGISGVVRPSFFGLPFTASDTGFAAFFGLTFDPMHRIFFLYYLILALALLTYFVTLRLRRLPVGRAWEALREDEIACRSLGMNTVSTKLTAFSIGAGFAGLAGSFFATRQAFISPESFTFIESAVILAIVVLGGMGSSIGVVVASVALIGGMEMLRNLEFLRAVFGTDFDPVQYRMLIFGLAMVLIMIWKPRGLVSTRSPSVFLKVRRAVAGGLVKEGHG